MPRQIYALSMVLALGLLAGCNKPGEPELPVHACGEAVGTFLTRDFVPGITGDVETSRSVLALTNGGNVMFTDSNEGGVDGYPPFTAALGRWRCLSGSGDAPELSATMLDFSLAEEAGKKQIARADFKATFDPDTSSFIASGTLSFVPLDADPYAPGVLDNALPLKFTGIKIVAP